MHAFPHRAWHKRALAALHGYNRSVKTPTIAILDDKPDRIAAMRAVLAEHVLRHFIVTFDNAPDTIIWLRDHLSEVALICLDHDLGPNRRQGDEVVDPGIGRDVADFLATRSPVCPVLIHTTNSMSAPGMVRVLEDAGWSVSRVSPYDDLAWVGIDWCQEVRRLLESREA